MKLYDSELPMMYSTALFQETGADLAPEHLGKMYDTLFTGSANMLNFIKSMDHPSAFVVKALNGTFIAGAIVQYFPNKDDKENPGNWSLVWTFNESDIPADTFAVEFTNPQSHSYFKAVAGEKYGMTFASTDDLLNTLTYSLTSLKKYLDENAKEGAEFSVEFDGFFQARVGVENGEKVFALEPDGEIKNLIKDDAAIEK